MQDSMDLLAKVLEQVLDLLELELVLVLQGLVLVLLALV